MSKALELAILWKEAKSLYFKTAALIYVCFWGSL